MLGLIDILSRCLRQKRDCWALAEVCTCCNGLVGLFRLFFVSEHMPINGPNINEFVDKIRSMCFGLVGFENTHARTKNEILTSNKIHIDQSAVYAGCKITSFAALNRVPLLPLIPHLPSNPATPNHHPTPQSLQKLTHPPA